MRHVPQPLPGGQESPPSIPDASRLAFVWKVEALDTLTALASVADDATRRPSRRKLSRREARRRFQTALSGLAWLRRMAEEGATC